MTTTWRRRGAARALTDRRLGAMTARGQRGGGGEAAGTLATAARRRARRLRTEGVILGFAAQVDSGRLGLGIAALILIAGRQPAWRSLREQLLHMSEVEFCAFTTGEYDALILVRVPDVETLRDVILERLQSSPAVRATQTVFVLDEVLRRPYVLP